MFVRQVLALALGVSFVSGAAFPPSVTIPPQTTADGNGLIIPPEMLSGFQNLPMNQILLNKDPRFFFSFLANLFRPPQPIWIPLPQLDPIFNPSQGDEGENTGEGDANEEEGEGDDNENEEGEGDDNEEGDEDED